MHAPRRRQARLLSLILTLALLFSGLPPGAPVAQAVSTDIVISQVYGGGGNTGAQYTNDFVELFNRGTSSVSLSGWSVQYASATGTGSFSSNSVTTLSGSLAPGQYYLVQMAGGANGVALPAPNATGSVNMSGTGGKVIVANTTTGLACNGGSTACSAAQLAQIVDLVGYDGANFFEGAAAPTLSNTTAAFRKSGGCIDTDNNSADFTAAAPAPRTTASALHPCTADQAPSVSSTSPANGAANLALNANISITFSEPVNVAGTWYTISCATSGSHTAAVSGASPTFTLDPAADFAAGESCTVTVLAAQVTDQDSADPPDNMATDFLFSFTTTAPPTRIYEIQGKSHISPRVGQTVANVPGIVTALQSNGFYLQDPTGDGDDATSDAIFVFTSTAPTVQVAQSVTVAGRVQEFRPGGATSGNLTTTEITSPSIALNSSNNPLPAPVVIGLGGRMPPLQVIEDDATGDVETSGTFDPANDGLDFYESLEGMLVKVNDAVAVGPTNSFGETPTLPDNGQWASIRTPRGGIITRANDFNPERLIVDDLIVANAPSLNVRDRYSAPLVGVLDYNFGNFMLHQVQAWPSIIPGGLTREVTSVVPSPDRLTVATFNVENLDPTDPPTKFTNLAARIVTNLRSPDIIAVEEVQDNNGPKVDDGTVAANVTIKQLTDAIITAGGPTYAYREIDPENDKDGGEPGGNIRVVFLYNPLKVTFTDRPGGTSTAGTTITNAGGKPQLTFSPGRVDPTNVAFTDSRKPLVGEFVFKGRTVFVIGNHWNSKGGDDPVMGHNQPPVQVSQTQRIQQATVVKGFVQSILAIDPQALIVVAGDLNDYQFSQPLSIIKSAGLTAMIETLDENERYSYVFEGNSQTLDHILVSPAVKDAIDAYDVVHLNAEFADQDSDHDPQEVQLSPDIAAPVTTATTSPLAPNGANGWYTTDVGVTLAATDTGPHATGVKEVSYALCVAAQTCTETFTTVPGTTAQFQVTTEGTTTITYFARDKAGNEEQPKTLVIKLDKTPPTLSTCSITPTEIWPPNHTLVPVTANVQAQDAVSGTPTVILSALQVVEGTVPTTTHDWAIGTADFQGQVLADRAGNGTGQQYRFTYTATDQAGLTATCKLTVSVPHDQGH